LTLKINHHKVFQEKVCSKKKRRYAGQMLIEKLAFANKYLFWEEEVEL
jgi:hypothetical protein